MPRSRSNRRNNSGKRAPAGAGEPAPGRLPSGRVRRRLIAIAVAVVLAAATAWSWWSTGAAERDFMKLAQSGRPALATVPLHPDFGNAHLQPGQRANYHSRFPLSGPHANIWTTPGFYQSAQRPEEIVHALEHGNIVVYYDSPGEATLRTLKDWAALYDGMWSGMVVTPMPGLGQAVVLTAWRRMLRLDVFDAAPAAAFIDAYRGRGPENPVR